MMSFARVALPIALVASLQATIAAARLDDLARAGRWSELLAVANRRGEQLPLNPEEALIAAYAARVLGQREAEEGYLVRAANGDPLGDVARLELAELVVASDPERAAALVLPLIRRAPTDAMRAAAVDVAVEAVTRGLGEQSRHDLETEARSATRSHRRRLEIALLATDGEDARERLGHLLAQSTRDLVALQATRLLQQTGPLSDQEKWWVAQALYRHALYHEAKPYLDSLEGTSVHSIPRWQVAYVRGRCAFRQGRWEEAVAWYARAVTSAPSAEQRADLEVHIARSYELDGRLDDAVTAAQHAIRSRTTDDRRLFLARLRLRLGQPGFARQGIARLRGRTARARGELLLALYDLQVGDRAAARRRLADVTRRPWSGPAAALAARLAFADGEPHEAIAVLERTALDLDPYWSGIARDLLSELPEPEVRTWRENCAAAVEAANGSARWQALARWAQLEFEPKELARLRVEVARELNIEGGDEPSFEPGVAADLWRLGLRASAVRWDPAGFPSREVRSALWSAQQFAALGVSDRAIRSADAAWRMAGPEVPVRAYPEEFSRTLYPLPDSHSVWRAAVDNEVPWSLVAAVAREESKWQPEALSVVGARGLMQLMPITAVDVASRVGVPPPKEEELFDPAVSLGLGANEIGRLLEVFVDRWAPAIAAYNAGEAQARLWLDQCGVDCPEELFVAHVTFTATSHYTRDVLTGAAVYADLYGSIPGAADPTVSAVFPSGASRPGAALSSIP